MPVFIYRKYTGNGSKTYNSVITSYCTISELKTIKENSIVKVSFDDFVNLAGNKTVYTKDVLKNIYENNKNVVIIELVYNGYFGKGKNITHRELSDNGLFETHPYQSVYTPQEFRKTLEMGDVDVQNTIID